eukprot:NODE_1419_length_1108_cov_1.102081.p1 type:complete len:243 gc:universal NODE_1419_length_1108_cov_1.102081:1015-287(-)
MSKLDVKPKIIKDLNKSKEIGQRDVEILVISRNQFQEFPEELLACQNARHLHSSINKIQYIPAFTKYRYLTTCDLSNNRLNAFPAGVLMCKSLKVLDISGNRLNCLSTRLPDLINLRVLRASDNFIREFPDELFEMKLLEVISLRNNLIKEIPAKIGLLKCLKQLFIQQNRLMTVPFSICDTSLGDKRGVLKLTKNLLVPILKEKYEQLGSRKFIKFLKESNKEALYNQIELELKTMYFSFI